MATLSHAIRSKSPGHLIRVLTSVASKMDNRKALREFRATSGHRSTPQQIEARKAQIRARKAAQSGLKSRSHH